MTSAEFLVSPLLQAAGFRHAFFTRRGGVSTGPFESLSFSTSVGDEPERVLENVRRAAAALGVAPEHLHYLSQVHGARCVRVDSQSLRGEVAQSEGDALVSRDAGVACGVRSADCVPVLLADRRSGAVAAAHAGWRGTVRRVVEAAVVALSEIAEGPPELIAAIGPHISLAAFEVSEEVAGELAGASLLGDVVDRSFGERPHVNLRRIIRGQLLGLGLSEQAIDDVPGCTVLEPDRFFSFRRGGAVSGRHLSAIVPRA
jgi:YfiH family protein